MLYYAMPRRSASTSPTSRSCRRRGGRAPRGRRDSLSARSPSSPSRPSCGASDLCHPTHPLSVGRRRSTQAHALADKLLSGVLLLMNRNPQRRRGAPCPSMFAVRSVGAQRVVGPVMHLLVGARFASTLRRLHTKHARRCGAFPRDYRRTWSGLDRETAIGFTFQFRAILYKYYLRAVDTL